MIALSNYQGPQQRRGNGASRPRRRQPRRPLSPLLNRMACLYRRIAKQERTLADIGVILRDDLIVWPLQCKAITEHLLSLRQEAQQAQDFYRTLEPKTMQRIAPWGTLVKLGSLDEQVTELLLLFSALEPISTNSSYERVELQLLTRQLYPSMLMTFEDVTSQLAALVEKAQEVRV